jgi:hypothetical protein
MTTSQLFDPPATNAQVSRAFAVCAAVAEAIREAGELPSGQLYAILMSQVDLSGYESMIRTLKGTGLVEERANVLRWIGPKFDAKGVRLRNGTD